MKKRINYEKAAHFLFALLDDVDTTEDIAKSDDVAFRKLVGHIHRRRFEVATTDGYTVTFVPEEGGEKCSKENGMMICYCGKCKPEDYPLPADFPKPCEEWEERFKNMVEEDFLIEVPQKYIDFIRAEKEASYDQGAAEASQVCSDMVVPQAYQQGREEMKVELREKISMDFIQMYLGGNIRKEHWYRGYTKCAQDIIEKLLS